jgi:outer membrane protein
MHRPKLRGLVVVAGLLAWATAVQADELKIAVVDLDQAINATDQGKKAREELSRKQRDAESQLKPMLEKGKAMADELQSKRFVLSQEALYQKQLDLAELENQVRNKKAELEGQFKVDYERLLAPLRTKLLDIVQEIGKTGGYSLVLERGANGLIYSKETLDITDQVIQKFNKKG